MANNLRSRLTQSAIVVAPGIYDGLSALIAEQSGAEALYLSGASVAYTRFGRPDIGLVGMSEVAETLALIRDRVSPSLPLIVDADTGFGNALNVQRTVRSFERCGANAIQLEDQPLPKRCGHLAGKELVSTGEMVGKIKAALDARNDDNVLIVARTDAIAVAGFDQALERAHRYADAGADVLFVEAPASAEQMSAVCASLGARSPLLANMVEGGRSPDLSAAELQALGFKLVIFPGGLVRAYAHMAQAYFGSLLSHGTTLPWRNRMLDFQGINAVIGTEQMLASGQHYADGDGSGKTASETHGDESLGGQSRVS